MTICVECKHCITKCFSGIYKCAVSVWPAEQNVVTGLYEPEISKSCSYVNYAGNCALYEEKKC